MLEPEDSNEHVPRKRSKGQISLLEAFQGPSVRIGLHSTDYGADIRPVKYLSETMRMDEQMQDEAPLNVDEECMLCSREAGRF